MASAGLAWSLANGITEAQYYENLRKSLITATENGVSDATIAKEMEKYGISAADLAKATGVATEVVQSKIDAVTTPGLLDTAEDVVTPPATSGAKTVTATGGGGGGLLTPDAVTPVPPVAVAPVTPPVVTPPVVTAPVTPPVTPPVVTAPVVTAPVTPPVVRLPTTPITNNSPGLLTPTTPVTPPVVAPPVVAAPVTPPVVAAPVTPTTPTRSAGLTWSLNNGITEAQYYKKVAEDYKRAVDLKLTDAQIRSTMDQYGISAADLAIATGSDVKKVEERVTKAVPTTPAEIAYDKAAKEELAVREAKAAAEKLANEEKYKEQQRLNKLADEEQKRKNQLAYEEQQRKNALDYAAQQKALADAERAKLDALRTPETNPFINAGPINPELPPGQVGFTQPTQPKSGPLTFEQNLKNYQSIPVGAQYNPYAVGGTGSPYSQIMAQAKPLGNPYANALAGQSMGGFNPALYAQAAATYKAEADAAAAAAAAAARLDPSSAGGGDDGDGGDSGGDGTGTGTGAASGDCVDPDVHILLADRSTVRAGDLKVGDMLHTLHDETFVYGDFPVEYVNVLQRPKVEALFDDGQKIIISITHKFLTADNKWEKISDIEIGTSIRGFGDVTKKLVSIADVGTGPVIEMVVTDAHTYISEGLVSHNKFYGGLITNVSGTDPAGPDEGQVNMMRGEYVIKKSSVNKYGRGLLDMINEGKIPAKKIRSLLD